MMWSKKIGDEVYVYLNGTVIMKRWLYPHIRSVVFDTNGFTYDRGTLTSITGTRENIKIN